MRQQNKILLGVVAGSIALSMVGLSASIWVKSPQEKAAEAAPPTPSVLTVPVQKRVLTNSVVLRGDVIAEQSVEVTPTVRGEGKSIVTALKVKAGDEVRAGQVLLEVGGRPLVALPGVKPAFRDLRPGYTGDDVTQLQAALKSLNFNPGESGGRFGAGTEGALTRFYASIGYPAVPTGEDDDARLAAAASQVKAAERALADANEALAAAPAEQRPAAQKLVDRATEDLAAQKSARVDLVARTGPTLPLEEYIFLPTFPARIDAVKAVVGAEVAAPAITVSSGALKVRSLLNAGQKGAVKPGMTVEAVSETLGITFAAKVESIGDLRIDRDEPSNNGFPMIIVPDQPLERRLVSQNVRLTIAAASSNGEVLVVPVAAVFSTADGQVSVIRRNPDGDEERVAVTPGLHGGGYVAVSGALNAGDQVVIGVQQP